MFEFWKRLFGIVTPDDTDLNFALDCFKCGDFHEALRRSEAIIAIDPQVALSWRFKGECLLSLEQYEEANEVFDKAISIGGPGTDDLFLWKALCFANTSRVEQARQVISEFMVSEKATPELMVKAEQAMAKLAND